MGLHQYSQIVYPVVRDPAPGSLISEISTKETHGLRAHLGDAGRVLQRGPGRRAAQRVDEDLPAVAE